MSNECPPLSLSVKRDARTRSYQHPSRGICTDSHPIKRFRWDEGELSSSQPLPRKYWINLT